MLQTRTGKRTPTRGVSYGRRHGGRKIDLAKDCEAIQRIQPA